MLLKLVLDILDVSAKCAGSVDTLPGLDLKFGVLPKLDDVIFELSLELELLVSGVCNIFNIFLEPEKVRLQ